MMWIHGDTHGNVLRAIDDFSENEGRSFSKNDNIVILGDWGVVWNKSCEEDTKFQLKKMQEIGCKFFCLLGNHDNYDWALSLELEEIAGIGAVRVCEYDDVRYDNIYIIAEPTVLNIDGESCFCIPGAECHDDPHVYTDKHGNKHSALKIFHLDTCDMRYMDGERYYGPTPGYFRILGESWWPQERIDVDKGGEILHYLNDNECHIDFVFTHDAPAIVIKEMNKKLPTGYGEIITEGEHFLDQVRRTLDFDCWFHGHMHFDYYVCENDPRVYCLYENWVGLK